jgi:PAS domain S-box-containing protein
MAPDKTQHTADTAIDAERYRTLIEEVADGFYETNLRGEFVFFNDALCRIFGHGREEIQDHSYRDFMDEKNARIAYKSFNRIYRTGRSATDIEWEIRRKDGRRRRLEISAKLIRDDRGKAVGFRGVARDVTLRHRAREAVRESERCAMDQALSSRRAQRRYRALLDFLPDPVYVLNLEHRVSYVNPAFVKVFGWTLEELRGRRIPFIPPDKIEETRAGTRELFEKKVIHDFETRRLTKDGRLIDVVLDSAVFYEKADHQPSGQVVILRDVSREKRAERTNDALFRIATALPRYRRLDDLLQFIIGEVRNLLGVKGASVILLDEEKQEFFIRVASYDDTATGRKMREIRFPADQGVAGHVLRTGAPLIVPDTSKSPYFFKRVDDQVGYRTLNMLDVPVQTPERTIGVLCAVNKKDGEFDENDVALLSTISSMVALPLENASINEALNRSYEEVKSLNRAKDRVIHHLSHELKTPVSVLSASLTLLEKKLSAGDRPKGWQRLMARCRRNLERLLSMQYEIEDILRERRYDSYNMLGTLLETCSDELEALVEQETGDETITARIRRRIDELFGPVETVSSDIRLDRFVADAMAGLQQQFAHRDLTVSVQTVVTRKIRIPEEVLFKIIEGLVRNAVENTPDGGRITVSATDTAEGPRLEVQDRGVGITAENRRLIFENYFSARETMNYATRRPYEFEAGGKGFDLLRMKIFSERYGFSIRLDSRRCVFIPGDLDRCPGRIEDCTHCSVPEDCFDSGGTTVSVQFLPAGEYTTESPERASGRRDETPSGNDQAAA